MKINIDWRIFFILLFLGLISVIAVFPYVMTVQADVFKQIGQPIELIFVVQFIQSIILFSIAIFFGLFFTQKIGFKLPLFEAIVEKGESRRIFKNIFLKAVPVGIVVALIIYGLDFFFSRWGVLISTHQIYAPAWQTLLASIYGGVSEEILLRLFLMTFFIWIGMKIGKKNEPTKVGIIISILLAAIIFGLGHLPMTASVTQIDALVVIRAVVLNGVGGVVFGWLFWKKGLESAMVAHFTTDVVLLTVLPWLMR